MVGTDRKGNGDDVQTTWRRFILTGCSRQWGDSNSVPYLTRVKENLDRKMSSVIYVDFKVLHTNDEYGRAKIRLWTLVWSQLWCFNVFLGHTGQGFVASRRVYAKRVKALVPQGLLTPHGSRFGCLKVCSSRPSGSRAWVPQGLFELTRSKAVVPQGMF